MVDFQVATLLAYRRRWLDRLAQVGVLLLLVAAIIAACLTYARLSHNAVDWMLVFRPAADHLIHGRNPYAALNVSGSTMWFFNPPWALLPVLPTVWMGETGGRAYMLAVSIFAVLFICYRLQLRPGAMLLVLFSLPVLNMLRFGQLEWLVLLGLVLPRPLGLFFLLVKPQVGAIVALVWAYEAWRDEGWYGAYKLIGPVVIAYFLSFMAYGFWLADMFHAPVVGANISVFPWLVPVGLFVGWVALRKGDDRLALGSAPLVAPYVSPTSLTGMVVALARNERLLAVYFVAHWAVSLVGYFVIGG